MAASLTSSWERLLSRSAKEAVKRAGMCCTMASPGQLAGRRESRYSSAWVPPVEVPSAMIFSVVRNEIRSAGGESISSALRRGTTAI